MTVSEGMDTTRARGVADQLRTQGDALDAIGAQGTAMMQVLEEAWSGPDTERFTGDWESARPQIGRAGQAVTNLGQELVRQADEQDATSDASGSGAAQPSGSGHPGGYPARLPIPAMPTINNPLQPVVDVIIKMWQAIRKWIGIPSWLSDALTWADHTFGILVKSPVARIIFKVAGKFTPALAAVIGLWDLTEAMIRTFVTEGPSWDAVMQFIQGTSEVFSGVLGIAALAATGSIAGIPLGVVLGALSLLFGAHALAIDGTRAAYKKDPNAPLPRTISGLPPDLVGPPGSGSPISFPPFPRLKWG